MLKAPFNLMKTAVLGYMLTDMSEKSAASKTKHKQKRPTLTLGTWNVRAMMTGLTENLRDIDNARKIAIINDELKRLNVGIATSQESHLAKAGTLKEKENTF